MIKDLPKQERPRERLVKYGVSALSIQELIAIVIRTGSRSFSALDLAREIVGLGGTLAELQDKTVTELAAIKGMGLAKAVTLLAAIELGRRVTDYHTEREHIGSPTDVYQLLKGELTGLKQEVLYALYLDLKMNLIAAKKIYIGSLNQSLIHPREVFKYAVKHSAYQLILVHNHPSGDPAPSEEDIAITKKFIEIGELMQIRVVDHVVVGDGRYVSITEEMRRKRQNKRPHR
ncbi:MAG: DNA repair protein RadC [Acholeplasmataceae bacterium]|nr:DNA repair protein RadC [Acholeplasmataceae bacterium]